LDCIEDTRAENEGSRREDVEKYFLARKDLSEEAVFVNGAMRQAQVINTKSSTRLLAAKGIVGHDCSRAIVVRELSRCRYSTAIVQQKDLEMQVLDNNCPTE
jgi:hypothetical protein